jgi:hypothetical protein
MHTAYAGDRCQRDKLDSSSCLTVSLHTVSQEIVSHMSLFVKVWEQRYTLAGRIPFSQREQSTSASNTREGPSHP